LDVLKTINLRFSETIVHGIAVVKSGVNKKMYSHGANRKKVKNRANATKITNMVETCSRDRRDLIRECELNINIKPRLRAETIRETEY